MLSKKTKYALNALVYLAKHATKTNPQLISQIAESEHIPKKFLETILLDLKNAGVLSSKKGKGGGYYLLRAPEDIDIADVIRLFDGAIALLPCATFKYYEKCEECKDENICGIRDLFQEVRNQTVKLLKENSLADILAREQTLQNQLQNDTE